jgi:hypothetical protein
MNVVRKIITVLMSVAPITAAAADVVTQNQNSAARTGVSGIWILANISYAGMRAQDSASSGWRIASFIFGFPGTFISFLAVEEGGERAYGIDIPRRKTPNGGA